MTHWFGNLSVSRKLGLGFGLVLFFTLTLAVIGWNSLDNMIVRSDRMATIALLDTTANQMQISRLQYMLADGDPEAARRTQDDLQRMRALRDQAARDLAQPANLRLLGEMEAGIAAYEKALEQLLAAMAGTQAARQDMIDQGNRVVASVDAV